MKILITGATGFIGQHLCHRLANDGHQVVALIRQPNKLFCLPTNNLTPLWGDLDSFKDPAFVIPKCDKVIHLAGVVTAKKQKDYTTTNFDATVNLFNSLLNQGIRPDRFVFGSSIAAMGPSPTAKPLTEKDPCHPIDQYGMAKYEAERFLNAQTEFCVTSLRFCPVIGGKDPNLFNLFKIAQTGFAPLPRINQIMNHVSIDDAINAIVAALHDTSPQHKTYLVCHPHTMTAADMWHHVARLLQHKIRLLPLPRALIGLGMLVNTLSSQVFGAKMVLDKKYYDQLGHKYWVYSAQALESELAWHPQDDLTLSFDKAFLDYQNAGWL